MQTYLDDREALYFFYQNGCHACEAAEPELADFAAQHPMLLVLRLSVDGPHAQRLGVKIKATPTYIYRIGSRGLSREGVMTAKEISTWLKQAAQGADE